MVGESELASVLGTDSWPASPGAYAASQKYDLFKNIAATALALLVARSIRKSGRDDGVSAGEYKNSWIMRRSMSGADRVGLTIWGAGDVAPCLASLPP